MVPFCEWDDEEHIAPSLDESPPSSGGESTLVDFKTREETDDFFSNLNINIKKKTREKIFTNHFFSFVLEFQYLFLKFPSNS